MAKQLLGKEVTAALNERIKANVAELQGKGDLYAGDGGKELEQGLVLDEPFLLQQRGHLVEGVLLGDGHGGLLGLLVQGQHVVGRDPTHACQQDGHADDHDHIEGRKSHHGSGGAPPATDRALLLGPLAAGFPSRIASSF